MVWGTWLGQDMPVIEKLDRTELVVLECARKDKLHYPFQHLLFCFQNFHLLCLCLAKVGRLILSKMSPSIFYINCQQGWMLKNFLLKFPSWILVELHRECADLDFKFGIVYKNQGCTLIYSQSVSNSITRALVILLSARIPINILHKNQQFYWSWRVDECKWLMLKSV